MTTIILVSLFLALVIGLALFMKQMKEKKEKTKEPPVQPPPPKTDTPEEEFTKALDSLLKLNLMIRRDKSIQKEMILRIEEIIDDLKSVIPAMMERYPGETLTYELKKIGTTHLYNTVKEFLDLSAQGRKNQLQIFETTIDNLHDVCRRSREIVDKNETAEFKTMAHFLAGKFS